MIRAWKSGYKIEHFGAFDELLSATTIASRGNYLIQNLSQKMKISKKPNSSGPYVSFCSNENSLSVSIPSEVRLKTPTESVWPGNTSGLNRMSFSWKKKPEFVQIEFPNHQRIKITRINRDFLQVIGSSLTTALLISVFIFHFLTGIFVNWLTENNLVTIRKNSAALSDISKIRVGLANVPISPSKSKDSGNNNWHARSLLNNWGPGKPLEDINQKLKPDWSENVFKEQSVAKTYEWKLESSENRKALNISDSEIAKALKPIQPHLQDCYDDVLIHDSSLKGRPKLVLQVGKKYGKIESLEITNLKAKNSSIRSLRQCFLQAYRRAQFPSPNQKFFVTYTLVMNH